ncbi:MAG TPA: radical SAM protein [Gemmatimonadales bacterium]|nr:radical SAM protein [Gemmatimonadales bacterium]
MSDATPQPHGAPPASGPLPVIGPRRPRPDGGMLWETIVNGPVRSRRLGTSLGLNLTPPRSKLCTFDCPYCECGVNTPRAREARWPSPDEVAHALRRALERLPLVPEWITFSGNGEPTMHPRFGVVVERVLEIRAEFAPRTRVGILSNGLAAGRPAVRRALLQLDARMMKLDPGPPGLVNGATYDADALTDAYRALKPYVLQAMVVRGPDWDGSSAEALSDWLRLLRRADPDTIHLYSLDRPPADRAVQKVPRERLEAMAHAIRETLPRCRVEVF